MKIAVFEENIEILKRDVKLNKVCAWAHAVLTGITGVKLMAYGKDWTFAFVVNVGLFALRIGVLVHKRKELANCTLVRDACMEAMRILDGDDEENKIIPFPKTK